MGERLSVFWMARASGISVILNLIHSRRALTAIVVYGRPRFFGLFGRENDCVIPWSAVKTIGEDAVLVDHIPVKRTPKRSFLQNFFENG